MTTNISPKLLKKIAEDPEDIPLVDTTLAPRSLYERGDEEGIVGLRDAYYRALKSALPRADLGEIIEKVETNMVRCSKAAGNLRWVADKQQYGIARGGDGTARRMLRGQIVIFYLDAIADRAYPGAKPVIKNEGTVWFENKYLLQRGRY